MQFDPGMEYRPDWGEGKGLDNRLLRPGPGGPNSRPLHPPVQGLRSVGGGVGLNPGGGGILGPIRPGVGGARQGVGGVGGGPGVPGGILPPPRGGPGGVGV
jgi:hypothetical protein